MHLPRGRDSFIVYLENCWRLVVSREANTGSLCKGAAHRLGKTWVPEMQIGEVW
jgi:hypothetical protein